MDPNETSTESVEPERNSVAAETPTGAPSTAEALTARARAARAKTQEGWRTLRTRIGAGAIQGADLARAKREQVSLRREHARREAHVGRVLAQAVEASGSTIRIEGALKHALEAADETRSALADADRRLTEGRSAIRRRSDPL